MTGVNTFDYIQNSVCNGTEFSADVVLHPTYDFVSSTENIPPCDHRVNVAQVNFSWGSKKKVLLQYNILMC